MRCDAVRCDASHTRHPLRTLLGRHACPRIAQQGICTALGAAVRRGVEERQPVGPPACVHLVPVGGARAAKQQCVANKTRTGTNAHAKAKLSPGAAHRGGHRTARRTQIAAGVTALPTQRRQRTVQNAPAAVAHAHCLPQRPLWREGVSQQRRADRNGTATCWQHCHSGAANTRACTQGAAAQSGSYSPTAMTQ